MSAEKQVELLLRRDRLQRIKMTCKQDHTWTEEVPGELVDSSIPVCFRCPTCGLAEVLYKKRLMTAERFHTEFNKEEFDARQPERFAASVPFGFGYDPNKQQFDA